MIFRKPIDRHNISLGRDIMKSMNIWDGVSSAPAMMLQHRDNFQIKSNNLPERIPVPADWEAMSGELKQEYSSKIEELADKKAFEKDNNLFERVSDRLMTTAGGAFVGFAAATSAAMNNYFYVMDFSKNDTTLATAALVGGGALLANAALSAYKHFSKNLDDKREREAAAQELAKDKEEGFFRVALGSVHESKKVDWRGNFIGGGIAAAAAIHLTAAAAKFNLADLSYNQVDSLLVAGTAGAAFVGAAAYRKVRDFFHDRQTSASLVSEEKTANDWETEARKNWENKIRNRFEELNIDKKNTKVNTKENDMSTNVETENVVKKSSEEQEVFELKRKAFEELRILRDKLQAEQEQELIAQAQKIAEEKQAQTVRQARRVGVDVFQAFLATNPLNELKKDDRAAAQSPSLGAVPAMEEYLKLPFEEQVKVIDTMKTSFDEFAIVRQNHDAEINAKLKEFDSYLVNNSDDEETVKARFAEMGDMLTDEIILLQKEITYLKEVKKMMLEAVKTHRDFHSEEVKQQFNEFESIKETPQNQAIEKDRRKKALEKLNDSVNPVNEELLKALIKEVQTDRNDAKREFMLAKDKGLEDKNAFENYKKYQIEFIKLQAVNFWGIYKDNLEAWQQHTIDRQGGSEEVVRETEQFIKNSYAIGDELVALGVMEKKGNDYTFSSPRAREILFENYDKSVDVTAQKYDKHLDSVLNAYEEKSKELDEEIAREEAILAQEQAAFEREQAEYAKMGNENEMRTIGINDVAKMENIEDMQEQEKEEPKEEKEKEPEQEDDRWSYDR